MSDDRTVRQNAHAPSPEALAVAAELPAGPLPWRADQSQPFAHWLDPEIAFVLNPEVERALDERQRFHELGQSHTRDWFGGSSSFLPNHDPSHAILMLTNTGSYQGNEGAESFAMTLDDILSISPRRVTEQFTSFEGFSRQVRNHGNTFLGTENRNRTLQWLLGGQNSQTSLDVHRSVEYGYRKLGQEAWLAGVRTESDGSQWRMELPDGTEYSYVSGHPERTSLPHGSNGVETFRPFEIPQDPIIRDIHRLLQPVMHDIISQVGPIVDADPRIGRASRVYDHEIGKNRPLRLLDVIGDIPVENFFNRMHGGPPVQIMHSYVAGGVVPLQGLPPIPVTTETYALQNQQQQQRPPIAADAPSSELTSSAAPTATVADDLPSPIVKETHSIQIGRHRYNNASPEGSERVSFDDPTTRERVAQVAAIVEDIQTRTGERFASDILVGGRYNFVVSPGLGDTPGYLQLGTLGWNEGNLGLTEDYILHEMGHQSSKNAPHINALKLQSLANAALGSFEHFARTDPARAQGWAVERFGSIHGAQAYFDDLRHIAAPLNEALRPIANNTDLELFHLLQADPGFVHRVAGATDNSRIMGLVFDNQNPLIGVIVDISEQDTVLREQTIQAAASTGNSEELMAHLNDRPLREFNVAEADHAAFSELADSISPYAHANNSVVSSVAALGRAEEFIADSFALRHTSDPDRYLTSLGILEEVERAYQIEQGLIQQSNGFDSRSHPSIPDRIIAAQDFISQNNLGVAANSTASAAYDGPGGGRHWDDPAPRLAPTSPTLPMAEDQGNFIPPAGNEVRRQQQQAEQQRMLQEALESRAQGAPPPETQRFDPRESRPNQGQNLRVLQQQDGSPWRGADGAVPLADAATGHQHTFTLNLVEGPSTGLLYGLVGANINPAILTADTLRITDRNSIDRVLLGMGLGADAPHVTAIAADVADGRATVRFTLTPDAPAELAARLDAARRTITTPDLHPHMILPSPPPDAPTRPATTPADADLAPRPWEMGSDGVLRRASASPSASIIDETARAGQGADTRDWTRIVVETGPDGRPRAQPDPLAGIIEPDFTRSPRGMGRVDLPHAPHSPRFRVGAGLWSVVPDLAIIGTIGVVAGVGTRSQDEAVVEAAGRGVGEVAGAVTGYTDYQNGDNTGAVLSVTEFITAAPVRQLLEADRQSARAAAVEADLVTQLRGFVTANRDLRSNNIHLNNLALLQALKDDCVLKASVDSHRVYGPGEGTMVVDGVLARWDTTVEQKFEEELRYYLGNGGDMETARRTFDPAYARQRDAQQRVDNLIALAPTRDSHGFYPSGNAHLERIIDLKTDTYRHGNNPERLAQTNDAMQREVQAYFASGHDLGDARFAYYRASVVVEETLGRDLMSAGYNVRFDSNNDGRIELGEITAVLNRHNIGWPRDVDHNEQIGARDVIAALPSELRVPRDR